MSNLKDKVNLLLKQTPLIYFCREAERAIGLEDELNNYHICCIEDSYIVDRLIAENKSVFCLERELRKNLSIEEKSTSKLLGHELTIQWIRKLTNSGKFFALTFLPSKVVHYKIEQLGGKLLNNEYIHNQKFEDKITSTELFSKQNISIPKYIVKNISDLSFAELKNQFGPEIVVQFAKGHTGSGTHLVSSIEEFEKLKQNFAGNSVKATKKIEGETFTVNVCIHSDTFAAATIQQQITGIFKLTTGFGSTVGNEFTIDEKIISEDTKNKLLIEIEKITNLLKSLNYKGIFGIDFMIDKFEVKIIELNARQTANIPFQTKLELSQSDEVPQMLLHIASFLGIDTKEEKYTNFKKLTGSQIFLRVKEDGVTIKNEIKSGCFRLQSDNAAYEWNDADMQVKENVIFIDEEGDKPLIFQEECDSIYKLRSAGFLLINQKKGNTKNKFDEISRMQFREKIYNNGEIPPWILEAFKEIEKNLLN